MRKRVNGEMYLDSDGNSAEHGQLADWSASLRVLENSGMLKVKREGGRVAMPFERYGPGREMAAGRRDQVGG
ncbi:hypothetical protein [Paenibacillus thiaminolyticus]|uniref:hypothetical protein n=1 Tax=Paenibacillus thiaminolyticus TaxID=49283 RepID=UPI002543856E|nr:hypothetical protein [Paenibacillus thiaminolyticus]WII38371.1 hypothetical protein O0V01_04335 [Paenibacillus thiaminolyticus]